VSRVRVKICGLTRRTDVMAAIDSGADALGFVFYDKSPRYTSLALAKELTRDLPPFVQLVGLFVNAERAFIEQALTETSINCLQLHGDEMPKDCVGYGVPVIKAIRVKPDMDVAAAVELFSSANGVLLDTYHPSIQGGTGESFNWSQVPSNTKAPIILAGGLTPDNIVQAIEQTAPYAVDVSGGVEAAKGIKDAEKISAFIRGVNSVTKI